MAAPAPPAANAAFGAPAPKPQISVHRLAHDHRKNHAAGADEAAGDDEHVVLDHESRAARREAGQAVQQRNHDGHVTAADRHDDCPADDQREREKHPECAAGDGGIVGDDEHDPRDNRADEHQRVEMVLPAKQHRPAAQPFGEFRKRVD
jgi:hypothetical protein